MKRSSSEVLNDLHIELDIKPKQHNECNVNIDEMKVNEYSVDENTEMLLVNGLYGFEVHKDTSFKIDKEVSLLPLFQSIHKLSPTNR